MLTFSKYVEQRDSASTSLALGSMRRIALSVGQLKDTLRDAIRKNPQQAFEHQDKLTAFYRDVEDKISKGLATGNSEFKDMEWLWKAFKEGLTSNDDSTVIRQKYNQLVDQFQQMKMGVSQSDNDVLAGLMPDFGFEKPAGTDYSQYKL